jgi:hypothetical protein
MFPSGYEQDLAEDHRAALIGTEEMNSSGFKGIAGA